MNKPCYAMVSTGIRRDLLEPIQHFTKLAIVHFYREAVYGDLQARDMDSTLQHYTHAANLYRQLIHLKPDAIQGVEVLSLRLLPMTYACYLAAHRLGVPLVLPVFENRPLHVKYSPWIAKLMRVLLKPVLRYAALFFPQNNGAQRTLLAFGADRTRMHRMLYGTWGVNLEEFSPVKDGSEPDFGAHPVLLYVGRLHEEKGVYDILEAFSTIKGLIPEARLVFVGDGPARAALRMKLVGVSYREDVHFVGVIKHRDVPRYIRSAEVLLSPSWTTRKWEEQVGMTNLQAMACGVPVVSTCSGAIPEYVPDTQTGLLVPERDPTALARAVLDILNTPHVLQDMGKCGRQYAERYYNAVHNVTKIQDLICRLLQSTAAT